MADPITLIGRGMRLEISKAYGDPKDTSQVTNASPGVATAKAAHGMQNGTVGFWSGVSGMSEIDGQATRMKAVTPTTFDLQGLNTSKYGVFTAGLFTPVSNWVTLARASSIGFGGGEGEKQDDSVLLDEIKKEINGQLAAQTVTIGIKAQTYPGEALQIITDAALNQDVLSWRLVMKDGSTRIWRGTPSLPGEDIALGSIGTGSITVSVVGRVLSLPA